MLTWAYDIEGHGWVLQHAVSNWSSHGPPLDAGGAIPGHGPVYQRLVESERLGLDESMCRERENGRGMWKRSIQPGFYGWGAIRTRPLGEL